MAIVPCPQCGQDLPADVPACSACGCPLNGALLPDAGDGTQRPPSPTVSPSGKLSPELLQWARQQFSEEEFLAGLQQIQETGGLELKGFIQELEKEAGRRD